ncbi:hypothetical protein [Nostoc sp. CHAB 5715]|uniref:hypothetical protein n=1 Tax=Nostoc sp. CHAB 5715 TaxID=2780400 RepID=UPI001E3BB573|nr:hypothetical protein [Nostoc sp. CHAB 5715]MCC5623914.1 hypothetical protein [Nostoc sp. CHAB 5715]
MHDVVGAYQRLNHIYQLYIKSAFPLRYRSLAAERDRPNLYADIYFSTTCKAYGLAVTPVVPKSIKFSDKAIDQPSVLSMLTIASAVVVVPAFSI